MKKYLFTAITTVFIVTSTSSQLNLAIVGGISPESHPNTGGLFVNRQETQDEFIFSLTTVKPQYFGGFKTRFPLSDYFFLDAGLTYTKRTSVYTIDYTYREFHELQHTDLIESEHLLLFQANISVTLGILEVTSGLTGIRSLSTKTELDQISGYAHKPNTYRMGWSTGAKVNIASSAIGIEYQGSLDRVCQGSYVNGESLELRNIPGQFVLTLQYQIRGHGRL